MSATPATRSANICTAIDRVLTCGLWREKRQEALKLSHWRSPLQPATHTIFFLVSFTFYKTLVFLCTTCLNIQKLSILPTRTDLHAMKRKSWPYRDANTCLPARKPVAIQTVRYPHNVLWHVDPFLARDHEISNDTAAVARQRPLNSNRGNVFSVRSVPRCYKQDKLGAVVSCCVVS
jgi:hypothetical protein